MDENQSSTVSTPTTPAPVTEIKPKSGNPYAIPIAILVGFGMIAAAIYFGGGKAPVAVQNKQPTQETAESTPVPEVNAEDHIRGNPNAPIVIVEYSDFDCPYCKAFHETMRSIMNTYGTNGDVAWVYRHFPIDKLHPSAPYLAAASECVAELGGNDAFWEFADQIFEGRDTNARTDTTKLPEYAAKAGVDTNAFNECVESERTADLVQSDLTEGMNAGVRGTPYSFILIAGQQLPINGAQPLEYMTANIDGLLSQLEKAETDGTDVEAQ